ncbi:hypothetical protein F5Y18DRAFT_173470 [Xylariaceae sp. FL1019]|nr:hypothetical protein F5Y18DRAFT_173470 [Xylariaceae sp. FL1019]
MAVSRYALLAELLLIVWCTPGLYHDVVMTLRHHTQRQHLGLRVIWLMSSSCTNLFMVTGLMIGFMNNYIWYF